MRKRSDDISARDCLSRSWSCRRGLGAWSAGDGQPGFYDDAKGWKGETKIDDAGHLSLPEQIAISAAGYTAEQVFECRAHEQAAFDDHAKIYLLLKDKGISERDHPARIAEGNRIAREHLEAHWGKANALAERLAECGHVDDASEFLGSLE
jgi:hypothetical protein